MNDREISIEEENDVLKTADRIRSRSGGENPG